jgi:signal transduction histidine kinase
MIAPVTQAPSEQWLDEATQISRIFNQDQDWETRLNQAIPLIRRLVIFDNLVIYRPTGSGQYLTLVYARATGRGRSQGAEITWGEPFARKVVQADELLLEQNLSEEDSSNRLERPILLGIPLNTRSTSLGVMVIIRFGSPLFEDKQVQIAKWVAEQIVFLLTNRNLKARLVLAEEERKQAQFQENFMSTITHELRTPLGFIKGYTTTLLRSDTQWDPSKQREILAIIDQETDTLQELIDNILDTARLQSGTMPITFQQMRIEPIVRDVIKRIETQHPQSQIDYQTPSDIQPIEGDPRRLAQVLSNLIINAIKYAPNTPITLQTRERKNGITVIVKDSGAGIPEEDLPHIFERFYRGTGVQVKHGSGLGLFICKQLVRSHHGRISVESSPGKGTRFIIHLPRTQPDKREDS